MGKRELSGMIEVFYMMITVMIQESNIFKEIDLSYALLAGGCLASGGQLTLLFVLILNGRV